jgi:hypothetical protein
VISSAGLENHQKPDVTQIKHWLRAVSNLRPLTLNLQQKTMSKKYKKHRQIAPAWVDNLITWLEFIGIIAAILAAIYGIVELFS